MNLANIHTIRKSFQALRNLCSSTPDQAKYGKKIKYFYKLKVFTIESHFRLIVELFIIVHYLFAFFSWLSGLEGTKWLQHVSSLLKASVLMVNAIDKEGRPVLVHCSDGWDRTPQLVALTEIMLDPYYRTAEVFFF